MDMKKKRSAPFILSGDTSFSIMADIMIALCPSLLWGFYIFGKRAIALTVLSAASAVIFEILGETVLKKKITATDLSSLLMGILFAMILPVSVPWWIVLAGNFIAIAIIKNLLSFMPFGGINAVVFARVILGAIFPARMCAFTQPFTDFSAFKPILDDALINTNSADFPLSQVNSGILPEELSIFDLIIGKYGGYIGAISTALILCGGAYLLLKKVISWEIPLSIIVTVAAWSIFFPRLESRWLFLIYELCGGALLFCAFFMAGDYASAPVSRAGKLIFGILCGVFTMIFSLYAHFSDGIFAGIIAANILSLFIDRLFMPIPYGGKRIPIFDFKFEKKEKDED